MLNSLRLIRWLTLQWRQGCSLTRNGADRGSTHDCLSTLGCTVCICAHTVCAWIAKCRASHTILVSWDCYTVFNYRISQRSTHKKYFKTCVGYCYKVTLHGIAHKFLKCLTFLWKTILASKLHHPRTWQNRNWAQNLQLDIVCVRVWSAGG